MDNKEKEYTKDLKAITASLSGAKTDSVESIMKPKERKLIYKLMVYMVMVIVLIIFGVMVASSIAK